MLKPSMLKVALRPFLNRCFLELASIVSAPSSRPLRPYNLLSVPLVSCGVLFQFVQITVLMGWKKNTTPWLGLLTSAEGELSESPLLTTTTEQEDVSSPSSSLGLFVVLIFSLSFSSFLTPQQAHFKELMARRFVFLLSAFLLFSLPPLSLSLLISLSQEVQ